MHLSPVVGKMTKCKALIGWHKTVLLSQALSNVSNVVRSLWLGYIILLTPWQPSETLLVLCDWYHSIQSSESDHTTWRMNIFCLHLQFFSSASKVKSRLKVYKTRHLHVHGLLPCYKTCSEPRKLLTDANFRSIGVAAPLRRLQHTAVPQNDRVRRLQRLISQRVEMSDHQQSQLWQPSS